MWSEYGVVDLRLLYCIEQSITLGRISGRIEKEFRPYQLERRDHEKYNNIVMCVRSICICRHSLRKHHQADRCKSWQLIQPWV
jgi:hypothetical protein